jgi:hypothetical protein
VRADSPPLWPGSSSRIVVEAVSESTPPSTRSSQINVTPPCEEKKNIAGPEIQSRNELSELVPEPGEKNKRLESQLRGENRLNQLIEEYKRNVRMLDVSRAFLLEPADKPSIQQQVIFHTQLTLQSIMLAPSSHRLSVEEPRRALTPTPEEVEDMPRVDIELRLGIAKEQIQNLRESNERLEKSLRTAKEREDRLRSHLHKLNETKSRTEKRLQESSNEKDVLQNEVNSLSTLSSRLANELHDHHVKLSAYDTERRELVSKIHSLRDEKHDLHLKFGDAQEDLTQFYKLDEERQTQLGQMMQQAASVESHLQDALTRNNSISTEYQQHKDDVDSLQQAQTSYQKQLSVAQFKLTLANTAQEEHRSQIDILRERETHLYKEIDELKEENSSLGKDLTSSREQLEQMNKSIQDMAVQLEISKAETSNLLKEAEEAQQKRQALEQNLRQTREESQKASKQVKSLGSKLRVVSKENAKLHVQLDLSRTNLKATNEEKTRLEGIVESQDSKLMSAEQMITELDKEMKAMATDSKHRLEQKDQSQRMFEVAKDRAERKVVAYEKEIGRLADANSSLQGVLDALSQGLHLPIPIEEDEHDSSHHNGDHPHEHELGSLKVLLADELGKLQETKYMLDNVVLGLLEARIHSNERGHLKQDSGIDVRNSPTPSRQSIRNSDMDMQARRSHLSATRSDSQAGHTNTPPDGSPSYGMFKSANSSNPERTSSWSSSDSTFSAFKVGRASTASPVSVTTTWTASVTGPEDADVNQTVDISADPQEMERREYPRLRKTPTPELRKIATSRNSFESTKLRYRSNPNLRDRRGVNITPLRLDSTVTNSSPPTAVPHLKLVDSEAESMQERRSLDSSLYRRSLDSSRPSSPTEPEIITQMPRRLSQLGMGRSKLRKLDSSMALSSSRPGSITPSHGGIRKHKSIYEIGEFLEGNSLDLPDNDELIVPRSPGLPSARPSMEKGGLRSPSLFGRFPRDGRSPDLKPGSSSMLRTSSEEAGDSRRMAGTRRTWVSSVVDRLKVSTKK